MASTEYHRCKVEKSCNTVTGKNDRNNNYYGHNMIITYSEYIHSNYSKDDQD